MQIAGHAAYSVIGTGKAMGARQFVVFKPDGKTWIVAIANLDTSTPPQAYPEADEVLKAIKRSGGG